MRRPDPSARRSGTQGIALLVFCCLALDAGGCALTQKASSTIVRYFTPVLPPPRTQESAKRSDIELRLGRVVSGAHIRDKIMYRDSPSEVGFYDDRMWTERPSEYLRRSLGQALFEEEGIRSIVTGYAPTIDVELVAFEEVRAPQHTALARLTFVLRNDRTVLLEQTLTVEKPIPTAGKQEQPAVTAEALGQALRGAVEQLRTRVVKELSSPPSRTPASTAIPTPAPTSVTPSP